MRRLEDMTEPELAELMHAVCVAIEAAAGYMDVGKPQFAVLVFNDPAVAQYASSCSREDMIKAMRETADRLERRETLERERFYPL
jgi:hypothetical protein